MDQREPSGWAAQRGDLGSNRRPHPGPNQRHRGLRVTALSPVWGIIILTLAVAFMWALTAHGRDLQA